jgi:hypothetical protein
MQFLENIIDGSVCFILPNTMQLLLLLLKKKGCRRRRGKPPLKKMGHKLISVNVLVVFIGKLHSQVR